MQSEGTASQPKKSNRLVFGIIAGVAGVFFMCCCGGGLLLLTRGAWEAIQQEAHTHTAHRELRECLDRFKERLEQIPQDIHFVSNCKQVAREFQADFGKINVDGTKPEYRAAWTKMLSSFDKMVQAMEKLPEGFFDTLALGFQPTQVESLQQLNKKATEEWQAAVQELDRIAAGK